MMVGSYYGIKACDYLNRVFPTNEPPSMFDGRFDPLSMFVFFPMGVLGMFLGATSCFWILANPTVPFLRRDSSKRRRPR